MMYTVMLKEGQTHRGYGRNWRKGAPVTISGEDPHWERLKGDDRFIWAAVDDPNAHEILTGRPDRTEEQKGMPPRRRRERELKDAKRIDMSDHFQITPSSPSTPYDRELSEEEVERILAESEKDAVLYDEEDEEDEGNEQPPEAPPSQFSAEVIALAKTNLAHGTYNRAALDTIAAKLGAVGPAGEPPSAAPTKAILQKWIADRQEAIHSQLPKVVDPS